MTNGGTIVTKERMSTMAGRGAFGACGGLAALYALIVFISLPGGIDRTESTIAILSVGILFLALIAVHVVYARILLRAGRGERFGL